MAEFLSAPNTDKDSQDGIIIENDIKITFGACSMQNWRHYQEDTFSINYYDQKGQPVPLESFKIMDQGYYIFSIFDGHGGSECSHYSRNYFNSYLMQYISAFDYELNQSIIINCFRRFDIQFIHKQLADRVDIINSIIDATTPTTDELTDRKIPVKLLRQSCGSTASIVIIDCSKQKIHIAHIGDSRILVFDNNDNNNTLLYSSRDHNPNDEIEHKRLSEAITRNDELKSTFKFRLVKDRIVVENPQCNLNVCRGFGDWLFKQYDQFGMDTFSSAVISEPDYFELDFNLQQQPLNIYLASDGIWNSSFPGSTKPMNEQIMNWANNHDSKTDQSYSSKLGNSFDMLSAKLPFNDENKKYTDNMTAILITINSIDNTIDAEEQGIKRKIETDESCLFTNKRFKSNACSIS